MRGRREKESSGERLDSPTEDVEEVDIGGFSVGTTQGQWVRTFIFDLLFNLLFSPNFSNFLYFPNFSNCLNYFPSFFVRTLSNVLWYKTTTVLYLGGVCFRGFGSVCDRVKGIDDRAADRMPTATHWASRRVWFNNYMSISRRSE